MKGIQPLPSSIDLIDAIEQMQWGNSVSILSVKKIILWGQWARFDPRLAEVWVSWVSAHWSTLNALELNSYLRAAVWPSALGPLLDQAVVLISDTELKLFKHWKQLCLSGVEPAAGELYWIGLYPFYSKSQQTLHLQSHKSYRNWGYLGSDWLINKSSEHIDGEYTVLTQFQREQVLQSLIKGKERLTVQEYVEALGGGVSRRVAQLELARCSCLKRVGRTKGAFYRVVR